MAEANIETVFEAKEESEAWAIQGLLQSAGVEVVIENEMSQDVMPGVGRLAIRVRADQAADARQIIASYQTNPPGVEEMGV